MIAWISGGAGQALVEEEGGFFLLEDSEPDRRLELAGISMVTRDWLDAYPTDVASRNEARAELQRASNGYQALELTSLFLDRETDPEDRHVVLAEAERLLGDASTFNYVIGVYCAQPMPESGELLEGVERCRQLGFPRVGEVVETVLKFQQNIAAAYDAWNLIRPTVFGAAERRPAVLATAVRRGLFLGMVKRIGDLRRCEAFPDVLPSLVDPFTLRKFPELSPVVRAWTRHARVFCPPLSPPVPLFSDPGVPRHRARVRGGDSVGLCGYTRAFSQAPAF